MARKLFKSFYVAMELENVSFHSNTEKGNAKEGPNYCTTGYISHARKVMLKILQTRFQEYLNRELPNVQTRFRKDRGIRDQIAKICWITEKAIELQKISTSALLTVP